MFVFAVTVLLLVAALSVWISRYARGFSAREQPSNVEAFVANQARHVAVPDNARKLHNPVSYSEQILEEARSHWADHCAYCHANDGSGDTDDRNGETQMRRNLSVTISLVLMATVLYAHGNVAQAAKLASESRRCARVTS